MLNPQPTALTPKSLTAKNRDPKGDHNFDNHPYRKVTILNPQPSPLNAKPYILQPGAAP